MLTLSSRKEMGPVSYCIIQSTEYVRTQRYLLLVKLIFPLALLAKLIFPLALLALLRVRLPPRALSYRATINLLFLWQLLLGYRHAKSTFPVQVSFDVNDFALTVATLRRIMVEWSNISAVKVHDCKASFFNVVCVFHKPCVL